VDSFADALSRLDPASRALLDLSLRRGMRPEEIAELLGTDPESVIVARESALEQLASELGMADVSELDDVRARLAELPAEVWTGRVNGSPAPGPKLAVADDEPEPQEKKERKSRLPLLVALLGVAALVLVIVLASSGGGDSAKTAAAPAPSKPKATTKPKPAKPSAPTSGPKVALATIGRGAGAHGTAALTQGGKRLRLDVSGLPDPGRGAYQVWLYDSVIETASLTKVRGTTLALDLKLPRNASHFRFLDISFEPADGNPNHSGVSVLRVPFAKLSR
jgi:hypothetical protein